MSDLVERMFPVMLSRAPTKPGPMQIPWSVAEKAYGAYAQEHGRAQSIERMAERGGFYWSELDKLYPAWRDETSEITRLRSRVAELEKENEQSQLTIDALRRSDGIHIAEVAKLRTALDKALALFDRYRRIGFSPCKDPSCYRATLTMMQESDAFLCEHEAALAPVPSGEKTS